jgi:spore maturation protein CgeB
MVGDLVKAAPHVKLGFCQYHDRYVGETHNGWLETGIQPFGLLLGADITNFPLTPSSPAYKSDICLVSGRWPEKAKELDKYILSLCYPNTTLDIKIFGNGWGSIPQCFGYIPDDLIRNYYASAVVCPNIHEPQALKSGIDVNQRAYQVISAGGFQISQRVRSMEEDIFFNDEVVFVDSPKEFMDMVLYFRENPSERIPYIKRGLDTVYENHTFLHRVAEMFNRLDETGEADKALGFADSIYYQMKQYQNELF